MSEENVFSQLERLKTRTKFVEMTSEGIKTLEEMNLSTEGINSYGNLQTAIAICDAIEKNLKRLTHDEFMEQCKQEHKFSDVSRKLCEVTAEILDIAADPKITSRVFYIAIAKTDAEDDKKTQAKTTEVRLPSYTLQYDVNEFRRAMLRIVDELFRHNPADLSSIEEKLDKQQRNETSPRDALDTQLMDLIGRTKNQTILEGLMFIYEQHAWGKHSSANGVSASSPLAQQNVTTPSAQSGSDTNLFFVPNNVWGIAPRGSDEARAKQLVTMGQRIATLEIDELQKIVERENYKSLAQGLAIAARSLAVLVENPTESADVKKAARGGLNTVLELLDRKSLLETTGASTKVLFLEALSEMTDAVNLNVENSSDKMLGRFSRIQGAGKTPNLDGISIATVLIREKDHQYKEKFLNLARPILMKDGYLADLAIK